MTYEEIKTIAAFGGFLLGIANLLIVIFDKFINKGTLKVIIDKAEIKKIDRGYYAYQINLSLVAKHKDIWLNSAYIKNIKPVIEITDEYDGRKKAVNKMELYRAIPYSHKDYLNIEQDKIKEAVKESFKNSVLIKDLKIVKGERKSLTLISEIFTERLPDEFLDFPLNNWDLDIDYGHSSVVEPLQFKVHLSNERTTINVKTRPVGFY